MAAWPVSTSAATEHGGSASLAWRWAVVLVPFWWVQEVVWSEGEVVGVVRWLEGLGWPFYSRRRAHGGQGVGGGREGARARHWRAGRCGVVHRVCG